MDRRMMAFAVCTSLVLTACGRLESDWDWNKATAANNLAAYQAFVREHPDDSRADYARGRILALQDDQAWMIAQKAATIEGFEDYLLKESGGIHVLEARAQLTNLQAVEAWKAVEKDGSAAALQDFLQKYPQVRQSAEARQMLDRLAYRVQLAEAHSREAAERERDRLQARFGDVVRQVVVVPPSATGTRYTLTSVPMTQADARSACRALEHAHQSCKLIPVSAASG